MAQARSKRQSRKRRRSGRPPQPPASQARETRAERDARRPGGLTRAPGTRASRSGVEELSTILTGATYGERPPSPFGGFPASEVAILAGAVGIVVWLFAGGTAPLAAGIIVCTLGVLEVTAREHFSGYRSHATLLAGVPAVAVGLALILFAGSSLKRATLLGVVIPVFAILFWLLRRRFQTARQARVVRPPAP